MKPYYSDGKGIDIYCGDCREVLPQLNWKSAAVVTDPPYGTGGWRREVSGNGSIPTAKLIRESWDRATVDWLELCGCDWAAVFFPSTGTARLLNQALFCGLTEHRCLYMKKLDPRPQFAGRIAWSIEPIWIMSAYPIKLNGSSDVLETSTPRLGRDEEATGHPYQKPLEIMSWIVGQSKHPIIEPFMGRPIVDPFMGSGTTLRAAKDLGRRAIGIEIEEKYCEIAAKRLSQEVLDFLPAVK